MDSLATFVIPIANYHLERSQKAIASARAQTVPSAIITALDTEGKGAGYARNRALEQVTTPFVVWLDADDEVHPQFIEKTYALWREGYYCYTDWMQGNIVMHSACPWTKGDWHVVTALVPTAYARMVGGFDEAFHGGEDSLFYYALTRAGVCPIRVPEPLFTYGAGGKRSQAFVGSPEHKRWIAYVLEKYEDNMACCGDNPEVDNNPTGEKQVGDVLAMATWNGNRRERGRATGRWYPRTGNGKHEWVSLEDIQIAPHLWRIVDTPQPLPPVALPPVPTDTPPPPGVVATAGGVIVEVHPNPAQEIPEPVEGVEGVAAVLWPNREAPKEEITLASIEAVKPAKSKPNTAKVRKLAQNGKRNSA